MKLDICKFVFTTAATLQVYMARDGLARFCTVPYQHPNNRNIHSAYMHLTNYSLNKRSRNYLHTESEVRLKLRCKCHVYEFVPLKSTLTLVDISCAVVSWRIVVRFAAILSCVGV